MIFLHKRMIIVLLVFMLIVSTVMFFLPQEGFSVTVIDQDKTLVIQCIQTDVAGLLVENGITVREHDRVEPALHTSVADGMTIKIIRAKDIRLVIGGETKEITTAAQSVEEVLALENIILGPDDRVIPDLDNSCPELIRVIRTEKKTVSEQKDIAYTVEKAPSENLYIGMERIRQKGIKGLEKFIYEVVFEDGFEVSRRVIEKVLIRQPVKQVVDVGTLQTVSRDGDTIKFSMNLTMSATGYSHTGNMTYTDIWPTVGIVAVDPKVIPLRTRLFIEGYGYATAMDTGGAIRGNRIDLFFETKAEAMKWGRRSVQVFILE